MSHAEPRSTLTVRSVTSAGQPIGGVTIKQHREKRMFRRLNDFGYSRSLVEAIGFYLAYAFVGLIAIVALAYVATLVKSDFGFRKGCGSAPSRLPSSRWRCRS